MGDEVVCIYNHDLPCIECGECEEDEDKFYSSGYCDLEGCIIMGPHFESECHTAKDLEEYYKEIEKEET